MSTYTNTLTMTPPTLALANIHAAAEKFNLLTENVTAATWAVLMPIAGPLLGLAFVIALPVLGVALAAYYSVKLLVARRTAIARHLKHVALFLAAPFIGLAYIVALPAVGFGALIHLGAKAARK